VFKERLENKTNTSNEEAAKHMFFSLSRTARLSDIHSANSDTTLFGRVNMHPNSIKIFHRI